MFIPGTISTSLLFSCLEAMHVLIKDIKSIETIQRRATKYILSDYESDFKDRLTALRILPLMYLFELFDILFFSKKPQICRSKFTSYGLYSIYFNIY